MSSAAGTGHAPIAYKRFRSPQTMIGRFVARRTMLGAVFWAAVGGAFVASKTLGFAATYPDAKERAAAGASFSNNVGITAMLGKPVNIQTMLGFTAWYALGVMGLLVTIWALLIATRTFRGEEDSGRWELLLAGQTTARRGAANALAGLGVSLAVLYVVSALAFISIGRVHVMDFGTQAALFLALAAGSGAAMFMAIGALASQLMPTRARAAGLSAAIFGACFLVRATADTTSASWLLNLTPLGWVEKLRPLTGSAPLWLLPIGGLIVVCAVLTVWLAGRRDLGDSTFGDKDTAKPHTALLRSPFTMAIRLTRAASLSWLLAVAAASVFFGLLTKSAADAFNQSLSAQHLVASLAHTSDSFGAKTFLGIAFFMQITLMMAYAASAVGRMREDEAVGYLDNLLVRPVSRVRWLFGRVTLATVVVVLAGLISGAGAWIGESSQQAGVPFHTLLLAGINTIAPALLVLGVGVLAMAAVPRLTTVVAYGVIAWSFLIEMVSSGLNLNHWLLDTSVLHHVALAPATDANWGANMILVAIGLALCLLGAALFNRRDLAPE